MPKRIELGLTISILHGIRSFCMTSTAWQGNGWQGCFRMNVQNNLKLII